MIVIYIILLYMLQPLIWLKLWVCGKKNPEYLKRWSERYGFNIGKIKPYGILIHGVSVGEVLSAKSLVIKLRKLYPNLPITFTTMTPSGSQCIKSIIGKNIDHVYLPYDLPGAVNRFLKVLNPKLAIFIETEIWPNIINKLNKNYVPIVIINARISQKSLKNYKIVYTFMKKILSNVNLIAVQNIENANRFIKLGVNPNKLFITGNLKFDIKITESMKQQITDLKKRWCTLRPCWIASSTHKGEEEIIISAHKNLLKIIPNLLLILAPRHPERTKKICQLIDSYNLNYILRTSSIDPSNKTQIIICDTIGELMLMYGMADLAFIGGSLIKIGGHNPLEAAVHKIPILMGPYTWNFNEICCKLKQANGLITVNDNKTLEKTVLLLFNDNKFRQLYGKQALQIINQNYGTMQRIISLIKKYL